MLVRERAMEYSKRHIDSCICDGLGFVYLDVPYGDPLFGVAIPCKCSRDQVEAAWAAKLLELSGLSEAQLKHWQFETFDPARSVAGKSRGASLVTAMAHHKSQCQEYANEPKGWLILQGPFGSGKTHLAYAIASRQIELGRPVYASTVPDLLDMLRAGYADDADVSYEKRFEWVQNVPLLVLDDLGTESPTKTWVQEKLYQIIDRRYRDRLPMVVTTNVDMATRSGPIHPRIYSRLMEGVQAADGWTRLLIMGAGDYRRGGGRS